MASGVFYQMVQDVKTALSNLGLKPVTDPRNARPLTVFIELPSARMFNNNVADGTLTLRVLAPPPGNQDAGDYCMTVADLICSSNALAVTDAAPSVALIGEQQLPAYDLTVRLSGER